MRLINKINVDFDNVNNLKEDHIENIIRSVNKEYYESDFFGKWMTIQ